MTSINPAIADAIANARTAMVTVKRPAAPPAVLIQEVRRVLDRPPSPLLASGLREVFAFTTTGNGEVLKVRKHPFRATEEMATEARERLTAVSSILTARPDLTDLIDWLLGLGELVAKAPTGETLIGEVKTLARNLDVPMACLTEAAMRAVARELRWWPCFAMLEPAMLRQVAGLEAEKRRLEAIIAATSAPALAAPVNRRETLTEEARHKIQAQVRAMDEAAGPRRRKRWTPLPVAPVRSVQEQIASLGDWRSPPQATDAGASHSIPQDVP